MAGVINTLDELLDDPMIQLVMARDNVRPEEVRQLMERARQRQPSLPPHAIREGARMRGICL
ncbi:hypothetical protein SAZ10_00935 [Mesorhizobium sp. BAC0120]|uniref:hypothetical protein n=1 Tax=Mesorhizobium sp. BAC0120 TaxID=3090670 RepID=UPI00298CE719|nr:hypothetical protein [Mesorhizobium sp. BAC0120]MDW6020320.1 hypothetical protein [Mesorhizobium sp. BAC0120]